jgi:hypothetical protein
VVPASAAATSARPPAAKPGGHDPSTHKH